MMRSGGKKWSTGWEGPARYPRNLQTLLPTKRSSSLTLETSMAQRSGCGVTALRVGAASGLGKCRKAGCWGRAFQIPWPQRSCPIGDAPRSPRPCISSQLPTAWGGAPHSCSWLELSLPFRAGGEWASGRGRWSTLLPGLLNALLSLKNRKSRKYGGDAKKDGRASETGPKIVETMVQGRYRISSSCGPARADTVYQTPDRAVPRSRSRANK